MSKNLSQIVADLLAKPTEGKELSSRIQRLGVEIRNVVQSEGTISGKFRGLLESFREIILMSSSVQAAIKALSTTSKLSRQEIIKAINGQLEELKIVEKSVMPSLPAWRDELKATEARTQERKGEMAKLRERIAQLENEEQTALARRGGQEKDLRPPKDGKGHLCGYQGGR
jgi:chromosome segregation ATPase